MSLRVIAGATLLALVATDAAAQSGASVSGSYCGTWASGNSWQMSLQQNGTSVSASVTGRTAARVRDRPAARYPARSSY